MTTRFIYRLTQHAATKPSPRLPAARPSSLPPSSRLWFSSEAAIESTNDDDAPANDNNNNDNNNDDDDDTPSEITTGTIQLFDAYKDYGFIRVPSLNKDIFVHQTQLLKHAVPQCGSFTVRPQKGDVVQFKIRKRSEDDKLQASEVTFKGGRYIPPFRFDYLTKYEKTKKAKFGMEVFDILDSVKEEEEMERRIVEAFEKVKADIVKQREKCEKILEVYKEKEEEEEESLV